MCGRSWGGENDDGITTLANPKWKSAFFAHYATHEGEAKTVEQYNTCSWAEQIGHHGTEKALKVAVKDGSCWPVVMTDSQGKKHKQWQTIRFIGTTMSNFAYFLFKNYDTGVPHMTPLVS